MAVVDSDSTNSRKSSPPTFWAHLGQWVRAIPKSAILSLVGPMIVLMVGYFGWRYYGARVLDTSYYGIKSENIIATTPPTWLRTSIVEEVFQGSNLGRMSLLDDQTAAMIARAFDSHPWVRKTHSVRKVPGGVIVSLEYREPVAMVYCEPGPNEIANPSLNFLPIDNQAYLLPTKDFNQDDIPQFLWIYAKDIKATDYRKAGTPFGDTRVEEAVALCRILNPGRTNANLERIYVYPSSEIGKSRWKLEIVTKNGGRVMWGSAPGLEGLGEPSPKAKLARLMELVSNKALIDGAEFDLSKGTTGQPNSQ